VLVDSVLGSLTAVAVVSIGFFVLTITSEYVFTFFSLKSGERVNAKFLQVSLEELRGGGALIGRGLDFRGWVGGVLLYIKYNSELNTIDKRKGEREIETSHRSVCV
jgi:hypothetical protein